ncbi:MAG TPA: OmpA family protein [Polyangia bacterium]|nr:OmpA family protein [Polyangia bacterium]
MPLTLEHNDAQGSLWTQVHDGVAPQAAGSGLHAMLGGLPMAPPTVIWQYDVVEQLPHDVVPPAPDPPEPPLDPAVPVVPPVVVAPAAPAVPVWPPASALPSEGLPPPPAPGAVPATPAPPPPAAPSALFAGVELEHAASHASSTDANTQRSFSARLDIARDYNRSAMQLSIIFAATLALSNPDAGEFSLHDTGKVKAKDAHGAHASKIEATKTDAAVKFFLVEKDKGPVKGVVVCLTSETGTKVFTDETDDEGYAEALVPVGQKYQVAYLNLGRQDVAAAVNVTNEPKQTIKLTLRFKRLPPPPPFVLTGITFDTGKSVLKPGGYDKLDVVVEFLTHKKSARVEVSGHTDNVGNAKKNKTLSAARANACRDYLLKRGIDGARVTAVGYGDEKPIAGNDTPEGREKNRRIEVVEQRAD